MTSSPTNLHHLDPPPPSASTDDPLAAAQERSKARLYEMCREDVRTVQAKRLIEWERSKRAEARNK